MCVWDKQDRQLCCWVSGSPLKMGSAPLPGWEQEGKRSCREWGAGEVKDLVLPCHQLVRAPVSHWGQTGHSSTGQRLLVPDCPELESRLPPPRTEAVRKLASPPRLPRQLVSFSWSYTICRRRKLKGCLSG